MRYPQPDRREALLSAMVEYGSDRDSPAWRELAQLVDTARQADTALARLWPPAPAEYAATAEALDLSAERDAATDSAVRAWLQRHTSARNNQQRLSETELTGRTSNVISGDSVLHGPSVQARDIHGSIHFHAPSEPPRPPVPRQLPPSHARFIDRESDRQALDDLRADHPAQASPVLVISGLAGVGKTTLATHWLHEHAASFPDGQLYADLGGEDGPRSPGTVLEAFLIALGAPAVPADTAQRAALWRTLTSGLRISVLLDNAFSAAQVRPLLLGTSTGLTVVTSRSGLTGLRVDGAFVHQLDGLSPESAVELLAVGGGERVRADPSAAHDVIELCGRLPLTVSLASAQLAVRPHQSVSALAGSLSQGHGVLDLLRVDGEAVMRTALDLSYGLLPAESAVLYRRMGLLPADVHDLFMLAAVADTRPYTVDEHIHLLVESNLLQETGPTTYRFHDLVRSHARAVGEEREEPPGREHALSRFVDWCLATSAVVEDILVPRHRLPGHDGPLEAAEPTPLDGPAEALTWLDTHRDGLMGAVRQCARAGWDTRCWRLVDVLWPLFLRFRPIEMWIEAHRLGLDAARRDGARDGEGRMLTSGAIGLRGAGRYAEAAEWYRLALEMAVADGNVRQRAQAVSGLGHISLLDGRTAEARAHFEEALRLREAAGHRHRVALTRRRLGETSLMEGNFSDAMYQLRLSYDELTHLEESYEATRVQALLGHVLERSGEGGEGTRLLQQALAVFRTGAVRAVDWEARCLEWLGQAAASQGDTTAAVRLYENARDLFARLSPSDAERVEARLRDR
ncbi:hypothetical protein DF268_16390 [Streptomyces sp. V2]|uniref:NB-ARC domain-containing protein n=1 Tax=Streptomyces sp. V2 TaxID=1424099 RepID=UPI000D66FA94|nr:NB-ARC domain-containing protein [Streptomyces sp. V2]PWG12390.1 hypothetical protein DF268_16390 [Streptomyces sp. V2]